MSKLVIIYFIILGLNNSSFSFSQLLNQDNSTSETEEKSVLAPEIMRDIITLGIGFGQDFGGIGGAILAYPQRNIGLFFGAGYNFLKFGYNGGVKIRFTSKQSYRRAYPFISAMYGYTTTLNFNRLDKPELNKEFLGFTGGIGFDYQSIDGGVFSLCVYIPFRGQDIDNYRDELKTEHNIETRLLPFTLSIGYRFILFKEDKLKKYKM